MKHDLFSANELTKQFDIDAKTLKKWLAKHEIEPAKIEETATDPRKYYRLKQFWPYLNEFSSHGVVSGGIESKTKEQLDKEIAFEKARKDKRDNDLAEKLLAPIDEIVQIGAPIIEHASKILDRVGDDCRVICPELDEGQVDEINQKVSVPVKNALADVFDRIQFEYT